METKRNWKRTILTAASVLAVLGIVAFSWLWFAPCWLGGCAPLDDLAEYQAEGSVLLDIHGEPYDVLATVNRRVVPLDSLPDHLPQAFLAVEDQRFYDHSGIDVTRMGGALLANVRSGGVAEGGSTITMQLARNLFPEWLPYTERSMRRKVMEMRVARQMERSFSKDKILELYLNHIFLGNGAYGVDAAARAYFGKPAAELNLVEAATIGGLPQAPSRLNPREHPEAALKRRDLVLAQMADAGYLTAAQAEAAQEEPLELAAEDAEDDGARGSYFVERVRREMEERIGSRFYTAGLKIHTTLDPAAQLAAEEELRQQLRRIESGAFGAYRHQPYSPDAVDGSGRTEYLQGAVVLMDAQSGEVRALVGGRDFSDSKYDRATQAMRQPGSAFKPFVYLSALERYGSPVHIVEDAPIRLTLSGGQVWEPKNYTGRYDGPMTIREGLTRSKNTVTVRLAQELGMRPIIDAARDLGITSEIPNVPSAALGAVEVRPIELVAAYAAFANGGHRVEPHLIRRIVDRHGGVVWEAEPGRRQEIDPAVAFVLTSMLQDVVTRGTGSAARTGGYRGPAAGKTGTTNDATDVWFIGYNPELVGGVWMGLDEPKTIVRGASGGTLAAPVWGRIMSRVYEGRSPPAPWAPPSGVVTEEVEAGTGYLASGQCAPQGPTYTEYFVHTRPASRPCVPENPYGGTLAGLDTLWQDEEWGYTGDLPADSVDPPLESRGIDWPELEELRREMGRGGEAVTVTPPDPPVGTVPPPVEPPREGPRLLGEPVRRDSTGARLPPPPPPDTARALRQR